MGTGVMKTGEKMKLIILLLAGSFYVILGQQLEILAFDFYRKFGHFIHLGSCSDVSRPTSLVTSSELVSCHLKMGGRTNFQESPIVQEKLMTVNSLDDVFSNIGLCNGVSVSHLGLLYNSECITVEIAKSITVDDYTYTLGYMASYRKGLELLNPSGENATSLAPERRDLKFYPAIITHGSKEMLLVSITYTHEADTLSAKNIELLSEDLADQVSTIIQESSNIQKIQIIRLSTLDRKYYTWTFPIAVAGQVISKITSEMEEIEIIKQRVISGTGVGADYMDYMMWPFNRPHPDRALGLDEQWRNVTICEIQLHNIIKYGESYFSKKCVGFMLTSKYCKRLKRRLIRVQRKIERYVHPVRANWYNVTMEDRRNLTVKCAKTRLTNERKMDRSVSRLLHHTSAPGTDSDLHRSLPQTRRSRKSSSRRPRRKRPGKKRKRRKGKGKKRRRKNKDTSS